MKNRLQKIQEWNEKQQRKVLIERLMRARQILNCRDFYSPTTVDLAVQQVQLLSTYFKSQYHV